MELPTSEEEEKQQLTLGSNFASDESGNQFTFEAIEAENPLIEDSERTCHIDKSDYCQGTSESENAFKSTNHTMCQYCVSS